MKWKPALILFILIFSILPLNFVHAQSNYWVDLQLEEEYGIRGESIGLTALTNASTVNVKIYDPFDVLIYDKVWNANETRYIPIGGSAEYGTYTIMGEVGETKSTTWFTVLDVSGWQLVTQWPYHVQHNGIHYFFYSDWTVETWLDADYLKIDFKTIRDLIQQYSLSFDVYYNDMNFLVRIYKDEINFDWCFSFIHSGAKIIINGSLDQPRNIRLGFTAKQFKKWMNGIRSEHLIFDWSDLVKHSQIFSYDPNTNELIVSCPQIFRIDPKIYEDGFESGDYNVWWSTTTSGNGVISAAQDRIHHGSWSSKSTWNASADIAYCYMDFSDYNLIYARFYVMSDNIPSASYKEFWVLGIYSSNNAVMLMRIGFSKDNGGNLAWYINYRKAGSNIGVWDTDSPPIADAWHCVEVLVDCSTSDGQTDGNYRLYVNGTEIWNDLGVDTDYVNVDTIRAGLLSTDDAISNIVWVDCVVVSDSSIGIEVYDSAYLWASEYGEVTAGTNPENILGPPDKTYATMDKGDDVYASAYNTTGYSGTVKQVYFAMQYYGTVSGTLEWYYQLDAGGFNKIEDLPEGGASATPLFRIYNATALRGTWTWANINATDVQFYNNDEAGPEDAWVDAIYIIAYYTEAVPGEDHIADVSQALILVEIILVQGDYIILPSQVVTSTWNVLTKWDAIIELTQIITTSWVVLTQTAFNVLTSISKTFTWTVEAIQSFLHIVDLTQIVITSWQSAFKWDIVTVMTQTLSTSWTVLTQTAFNVVTSIQSTFTWIVDVVHTLAGILHKVELTQTITTSWIVDAFIGVQRSASLSLSITTSWIVDVFHSIEIPYIRILVKALTSGLAVPQATVTLSNPSAGTILWAYYTDPEGYTPIEELEDGTYYLTVFKDDYQPYSYLFNFTTTTILEVPLKTIEEGIVVDIPMIILSIFCIFFSILWWGTKSDEMSIGILTSIFWITFAFYWLFYGPINFPILALAFGLIGVYTFLQVFAESLEWF